jgi:hypothetical protein
LTFPEVSKLAESLRTGDRDRLVKSRGVFADSIAPITLPSIRVALTG